MRRLALALALAVTASAAGLAADSPRASLRVGVEVTRRCAVTGGPTPEVRCTRMPRASATPLVVAAPPSATPLTTSSPRVVTVLF